MLALPLHLELVRLVRVVRVPVGQPGVLALQAWVEEAAGLRPRRMPVARWVRLWELLRLFAQLRRVLGLRVLCLPALRPSVRRRCGFPAPAGASRPWSGRWPVPAGPPGFAPCPSSCPPPARRRGGCRCARAVPAVRAACVWRAAPGRPGSAATVHRDPRSMAAALSARQPPVQAALGLRCWEGSLPLWRQRPEVWARLLGASGQGLALLQRQHQRLLSLEQLLVQGLLMQQALTQQQWRQRLRWRRAWWWPERLQVG